MSVEVLTNGCWVSREYVSYQASRFGFNPTPSSAFSISFSSYPDVILMISFTATEKATSTSAYKTTAIFTACNNSGYNIGISYNTQGCLSAPNYTDPTGTSAGLATVMFRAGSSGIYLDVQDVKYVNGSVIYMPSQSSYAADWTARIYGYNNI